MSSSSSYTDGDRTITDFYDGAGNYIGTTFVNSDGSGSFFDYAHQTNSYWNAPSSSDLYFWSGFWAASVVGAEASGGGGSSYGGAGPGVGVGYEFGFSTDPAVAAQNADNTHLQLPGVDVTFDTHPFTLGITINGGVFLPIVGSENAYPSYPEPWITIPNVPPVDIV